MTTTVDRPNKDAINKAIDIYRDAMRPFIVRSLRGIRGQRLEDVIYRSLNPNQQSQFQSNMTRNSGNVEAAIDVGDFPHLISRNWRDVFSRQFPGGGQVVQNLSWVIKEARDKAAHPDAVDLDTEFTRSRLYDITDVLGRINAPAQRQEVEAIRDWLLSGPQQETDTVADAQPEGQDTPPPPTRSASNLAPWRDVIRPNPDVAQGIFRQAEFAADLQQVHDGRADATQYGNPVSFFNHTYITPGIRTLLLNTLKCLSDNGGHPVIQTKTGFGGGKTHSLIALYHLVKNAGALTNATGDSAAQRTQTEIREIMEEAGIDPDDFLDARVAVLVGTHLAATDAATTDDGDPLNTLWGEMAYQLGGQQAYDIVGEAARQGTSPGGRQLDELFSKVAPCVILIDELVAHVRNAGAAQDNIYTFIQTLTEAVRRNERVALVVTLPESAIEAGGDAGLEALSRLDHILGRIEATWEPLEVHEAFEVVRRRLFDDITDEAARDRACEAFSAMYGRNSADYPQEAREHRYLQRMKDCYPIHPEIFDRLYSDWSSIPRFQRTRAVLRMLSTCVSRLYLSGDTSPMIMPANLTLSDPSLADEFANLLPGNWAPVLSEIDADNSGADIIDKESPQRFGGVGGAARRIARCVFLGSAPSGSIRGIDPRRIHLGVVAPGHGVPVYQEALRRMTGNLYYLYGSDERYYFRAEENLNKVASDRADNLQDREIYDRIRQFMTEAIGRNSSVIVFPDGADDVPDADFTRLVILPPDKWLPSRSQEADEATPFIKDILQRRGDAARVRKNTLLFLGARRDEIRNLNRAVRSYLAWNSIFSGDRRIENLTGDRYTQARASADRADRDVRSLLVSAYRWALAPNQQDPQRADYGISRWQVDTGRVENPAAIAENALAKFIEQEALVNDISTAALDTLLRQYIWNDSRDHIGIDELWDILTANVYMHRLQDKSVLLSCVMRGVQEAKFGYADRYDQNADENPYTDIRIGEPLTVPSGIMGERILGLLIKPGTAQAWKELDAELTEQAEQPQTPASDEPTAPEDAPECPPDAPEDAPQPAKTVSITASKFARDDIDLNDISLLREEIIRNLREDGGEVSIEIVVRARKPDGFSESATRAVRENGVQLGFDIDI